MSLEQAFQLFKKLNTKIWKVTYMGECPPREEGVWWCWHFKDAVDGKVITTAIGGVRYEMVIMGHPSFEEFLKLYNIREW